MDSDFLTLRAPLEEIRVMISHALFIGLGCILGYQALRLLGIYRIRRPVSKGMVCSVTVELNYLQNLEVVAGLPTVFGQRFTSLWCLLNGPEFIIRNYKKASKSESQDSSILKHPTGCRQGLCHTIFQELLRLYIGCSTYQRADKGVKPRAIFR